MYTFTLIPDTKKIILGCIFLIISNVLYAQKSEVNTGGNNNNWSVNLNGGSTQFWGYLNTKEFSTNLNHLPTWGYGLMLTRKISPSFGISGQFLMGKIKGRKDVFNDGTPANLIYFSDFVEVNLSAKVNFTNMMKGYKPGRMINIYGLVGLGISNFQGHTVTTLTYQPVHYYGYGSGGGIKGYELEGLMTAGLGLSVKLNKKMDFTFENSMKFNNTNKLDEIKGLLKFDAYGYSSIGLTYNFRLTKEKKNAPIAKNAIQEKAKPVPAEKKPADVKKEVVSTPAPVKAEPKAAPVIIAKEPEVKKDIVPVPAPVKAEPKNIPAETVKKQELKPVENVVLYTGYKVQIFATSISIPFESISQQYNLTEQIREDHSDKWFRYSVGEFRTFAEASAYRKILFTRNKLKDSFIVKIKDGKRVGQVWE